VSLQLVYQKVGSNITNLVRNKGNATLTGGVGGSWSEESNFQEILGVKAPVIAEATDNLLDDEDASFESGTRGNWNNAFTPSIVTTWAKHGTRSMKCSAESTPGDYEKLDVTSITSAGSTYTVQATIKAVTAGTKIGFYQNVAPLLTWSDYVDEGNEGLASATITFDGASTTRCILVTPSAYPCEFYIDAIQLEQKAYATPFALNSRTATTCKFPTADLGLTAGQDLSIVVVTKTPWAGDDGANHAFWSLGDTSPARLRLYKSSNNKVYLDGNNASSASAALNSTTWAADTMHIVISTIAEGGAIEVYLDGSSIISDSTTRENSLDDDFEIGTLADGSAFLLNAPILVAIFDRVLSPLEIQRISDMKTDKQSWLSPNFVENLSRLGGSIISPQVGPLGGIDELHYIK